MRAVAIFVFMGVGATAGVAQPFTTTYNVPGDVPPNPLPSDTQLNVSAGGALGNNYLVGNTSGTSSNLELNVLGGTVGYNLQARPGSTINISGGVVGDYLKAYNDSTVDITGGQVGFVEASSGSYLNVGGGEVGRVIARGGSLVSLTGGIAGDSFTAEQGAVVYLTGGTVGNFFSAYSGSRLNIYGNEFLLNGAPVPGFVNPGSTVILNDFQDSILSGTLEDGSVFILSSGLIDNVIGDGVIKLYRSYLTDPPPVIDVPSSPTPDGIRAGQTLNLHTNGVIGNNFDAVRGTLNVAGGVVGENLELIDTTVNLTAGEIGFGARAYTGSTLNIDAGSVDDYFRVADGSTVTLNGGQIGERMSAGLYYETDSDVVVSVNAGSIGDHLRVTAQSILNINGGSIAEHLYVENSTVNMTGGEVGIDATIGPASIFNISGGVLGDNIEVHGDGTLNISGGEIGNNFDAYAGSSVNIIGTSFFLNGLDLLPSLAAGVPLEITDRNKRLWGTLADGTPFSFDLNSSNPTYQAHFSTGMTLTITSAHIAGDLDGDGFVGIDDLNLVLSNWNQFAPPANPLADPSGDGYIGIDDLNVILANWNAGVPSPPANAIPEPAVSGLLLIGYGVIVGRRR